MFLNNFKMQKKKKKILKVKNFISGIVINVK